MMLSNAGPGSQAGAGIGESRSSGVRGSSVPPGSTRIRPVTEARPGQPSRRSAAFASAPGAHQVSSSQKAT